MRFKGEYINKEKENDFLDTTKSYTVIVIAIFGLILTAFIIIDTLKTGLIK